MPDKTLTCYGVDNGFSAQLTLDEDTHILFDLKQKSDDADESDKTADVQEALLLSLPKDADGRRHLSTFCLSHADLDHCQGFGRVFLLPGQNESDEDDDLIQIDELWVTAQIFREDVEGPADMLKKEAKRRLGLWSRAATSGQGEERGNMLVVFGRFEDEPGLAHLPDERRIGAGETLDRVCGDVRGDLEVFAHWPFKAAVDDEELPRNEKSMVIQVRVVEGQTAADLLIGGDAGCAVWKSVYKTTLQQGNLDRLDWDVFFVPHHGTYKFFTEKEHEEGRKEAAENPAPTSMAILQHGRQGGWLVCSSRPIREGNYEDKDPPHIEGVKHYRERAEEIGGEDHFISLMQYPSENEPEPLVFRFTSRGLQKSAIGAPAIAVGGKAVSHTSRWGGGA